MPANVSVGLGDCSSTPEPPSTATWCDVIGKPVTSKVGNSPAMAAPPHTVRAAAAVIGNNFFMVILPRSKVFKLPWVLDYKVLGPIVGAYDSKIACVVLGR
jgi:hypothetical protein